MAELVRVNIRYAFISSAHLTRMDLGDASVCQQIKKKASINTLLKWLALHESENIGEYRDRTLS